MGKKRELHYKIMFKCKFTCNDKNNVLGFINEYLKSSYKENFVF